MPDPYNIAKINNCAFLRGKGEMAQRIKEYDWSTSLLGDAEGWPLSLKTTLNLLINNKFPMFLWWGPELVCFYNDAYRPSLGNEGKHPDILGMPAAKAWPEIWDYISPLIDQVMTKGESIFMEDLLLPIFRNGEMQDAYWTFAYGPVINEKGECAGVLVTCNETTQKIALLQDLQESERRFQTLIRKASVGIIVLTGKELKVAVVNDAYGRLIGKTVDDLLGKALFDVIPESEAEYRPIIESVLASGDLLTFSERPNRVFKGKEAGSGYLDIIYQPFKEVGGESGIMVLCHDVTHQVHARLAIRTTLDQLRLSKEAAQLGMFDMDLEKGTLEWDSRCRTLFGISHADAVTYENDFVLGLHADDRNRITAVIDNLLLKSPESGDYDVEYRTVGAEDGKVRWVRAKGKVYFNSKNKPIRFIGSVLDITPEKISEARKNDFIAMVSHELKTPLTSLMGYVQLLLRNVSETNDEFQKNVLSRANMQTKKMNGMINGFLNVSRFESGRLQLQPDVFSLTELLQETIDNLSVGAKSLRFQFAPNRTIKIEADREKIESVTTNLLSNALKYSQDIVTVTCEEKADAVIVCVADKGIGINTEDVSFIFDRFYRVESQQTKDIGGFGIGLYISAEIIKMHGGVLRVESEYGKGSRFYFSLPLLTVK